MIAFLLCALALPASNFTRPAIVSYQAEKSEEDQLIDWLKKSGELEEVFIHENPQEGKLKEYGWERLPFSYKGKQIWGKRKPISGEKKLEQSA